MEKRKKVGVIGGGAAGFFAAISAKQHHPDSEVILFEKTAKILSKVKISGGGRCNVTHHCDDVNQLLVDITFKLHGVADLLLENSVDKSKHLTELSNTICLF